MATIINDLGLVYYEPSKKRVRFAIFECIRCKSPVRRKYRTEKPTCKKCIGKNAEKHGLWSSPIYRIYSGMIGRCYIDDGKQSVYYKKKGITICKKWVNDFKEFEKWAVATGYKKGMSIERKDNDLGYSPDNCMWIKINQQPENRTKFSNNTSGYMGVSYQKGNSRYKAYASINKKQHYLGMFKTAKEAAIARDKFVVDNNLRLNLNFK